MYQSIKDTCMWDALIQKWKKWISAEYSWKNTHKYDDEILERLPRLRQQQNIHDKQRTQQT